MTTVPIDEKTTAIVITRKDGTEVVTIVDSDTAQFLELLNLPLFANVSKHGIYIYSKINGKCIALHRLLAGYPAYDKSKIVHHCGENFDTLDNRRQSLKLMTPSDHKALHWRAKKQLAHAG